MLRQKDDARWIGAILSAGVRRKEPGVNALAIRGGVSYLFPPVQIARVLLDQALDRPLDYAVPDSLIDQVGVGSRVRVPLQNRQLLGTVLDLPATSEVARPRELTAVLNERPLIGPVLLRLAHWISHYYFCREEVALRCVLPQVVRAAKLGPRQRKAVEITTTLDPAALEKLRRRAPKQAAVLEYVVARQAPVPLTELEVEIPGCSSAVQALVKNGHLRSLQLTTARDPDAGEVFLPTSPLTLNAEQATALAAVQKAMAAPKEARPLLLHGVTGSGKTEIYLQAAESALAAGKTCLVLVPEISLAPQTVERFKSRFAQRQQEVAVLHSHLSEGERHDEWFKIHSGAARMVIGARSAVFAPLDNLGLIIVDEEHENSYKQEEAPKYQARDVAVMRASMEPCAILLGSATPSAESYANVQKGKYQLLELTQRADDRQLPIIRILDLRVQRRRSGPDSLFSPPLSQAIQERLAKQEQIILFLNRRGYSTSLICASCGHVCTCPDCSVALTYHREVERLVCHICGHSARAPKKCPECSDPGIRFSGVGTQKIEEMVQKAFPKARVARMDADAMSRKDAYRETLGRFRKGALDILVGTQMIAKGLHFPNVTLVGIINADLGLHVPDFRAGERTFQLLTQVAGRAGRGEMEGEVMVQTFTPGSPAIQFARHHDFAGFWEQEKEFREQFRYPPFIRMVLLTVRSPGEEIAEFTAATLHRKLEAACPPEVILGAPAPAPLAKAKGQFRFQISLRAPRHSTLVNLLHEVLDRLPLPEEIHVSVDIDPFSLL
jgi:primosomal protein N' (replication factor Y)